MPILVEMRDESTFDDTPLKKYWIFPHFSHFSHFLAKNGCFWSSYLVQVISILEMSPRLVECDEI